MAMDTKVIVKPSLGEFLREKYEDKRREVRKAANRNLSQNEYAQDTVGMIPQTFSRYINGESGMTLDSAVILLKAYGPEILPHFDFSRGVLDEDTATIIANFPRLSSEKKKAILNFFDESTESIGLDAATG